MRYKALALVFLHSMSSISIVIQSEGQEVKSNFYLEILGNAGAYSVNYEKLFAKYLAGRFGMGLLFRPLTGFTYFATVTGASILLPRSNNFKLELGMGFTIAFHGYYSNGKNWLTGVMGIRYQPGNEGVMFRAVFIPVLVEGIPPWGGVSFGYAF